MTRRRVLVIAGFSPSLINFRGALLASLVEAGHEVHAAAPGLDEDETSASQLHAMGVQTHSVDLQRTGMNPIQDLRSLVRFCGLMRRLRPHTVLAYTIKPVVWGGIAARIMRVPRFFALITGLGYAFTGDAHGTRLIAQRLAHALYRVSLRKAAGVIFQNPDDAAEFRSRGLLPDGLTEAVVNGSGVDLARFANTPLPDAPCSFVMIARLLGDKGVREYAAAAAVLKDRGAPAQVHLVGAPDTNADSISADEAQSWHGDGRLVWHGHLADVRPAIAAAHVVVLPSYYREGTPRTILEGMAMGRAIITTDAPGCKETVKHGENGFLVPIRDARALADAMQQFVDAPALVSTMGQKSSEIAREKYDVHKVNAVMLRIMGLD